MGLISTGLPNGGVTTSSTYKFLYDSALGGPGGIEPARTTQVMAACEGDFSLMQSWFAGVSFPFSTPMEVDVNNDPSGTASWGPPVQLNSSTGDAGYLRMLLIAEVTEMFMKSQAKGWYPGDMVSPGDEGSNGEGLSRFLAEQFLILTGLGFGEFPGWGWTANTWLQSATQPDYVNNVDSNGAENKVEIGCSILFIYYLFTQLQFTIDQIVAGAAIFPAGVYTNLTGDSGNPFPFFQLLVNTYPGPGGLTTGSNLDNPFPVGLVSIWTEKSTFGYDEVQDVIQQNSGVFSAAFWVVVEGFSKYSFGALGVTVALDGTLTTTNGITVQPSATAQIDYEDLSKPNAPQRIRIPYDISFTTAADGAFPATGSSAENELDLHVDLQSGGQKVAASDAYAAFELVAGADPYFTNVDPTQGNVYYLSQDLRVFTATPALSPVPVAGGPAFGADSVAGAYSYIQSLLGYLNGDANFTSGGQDPFATVLPAQGGALQGDSSVTPLSNTSPQHNNYNFAIARVRLRGSSGKAGEAQNVRVFFRLWITQTADTDYQPSSTYLSALDAAQDPAAPLVGVGTHTIPFFATGNLGSNTDYNAGGINNQNITIASGDTAWQYFGCFLNVYDSSNIVNGRPVQAWLAGTHHCLVAQIACDTAPIPTSAAVTPSPENSDKLAQRNLQITASDNPGGPETHRIPQTFDVRPTKPGGGGNRLSSLPDELMIDWGDAPVGSVASIYWPQVQASDVLSLANALYSFHALGMSDANTITCSVTNGVTYVPIPASTGDNYAGLLTIDLPPSGVVAGQQFEVVVRRVVTTQIAQQPSQPQQPAPQIARAARSAASGQRQRSAVQSAAAAVFGPPREGAAPAAPAAVVEQPRRWRFVTGAFQVQIPVKTPGAMLPAEENTLAILKWRLQQLAPSNRWRPVLQRYIGYISARVAGLGGDPNLIPPSLNGAPITILKPICETAEFVGKVVKIIYDCFGDFQGFVLDDCCEQYEFVTRERGLSEIIISAFRHRFRLVVIVAKSSKKILKVVIVE